VTRAVLFDFTGTLFWIEDARAAVTAALGSEFADHAPALQRWSAINGSGTPDDLPAHLADVWARRDLAKDAHRLAYSGLAVHAGLTDEQARLLYERGITAEAWHPYPDTADALRAVRAAGARSALVSNIGWDPRPVLQHYRVRELLDVLVLSDEREVQKPDPAIFELACAELGVTPGDACMIGDNPDTDGAATRIGIRFVLVDAAPERDPKTLLRAIDQALG
jgi:HAD superfamily hydrolase (TIGR01493 family)